MIQLIHTRLNYSFENKSFTKFRMIWLNLPLVFTFSILIAYNYNIAQALSKFN